MEGTGVRDQVSPISTLGEFLGRNGTCYLRQTQREESIFSFDGPLLSLTRQRVMLHLADFAKVVTGHEKITFPSTITRSAAATTLTDFAAAPMPRTVLVNFAVSCMLGQQRVPPSYDDEPLGLAWAASDAALAAVSSDVDTMRPANPFQCIAVADDATPIAPSSNKIGR